MVLSDNTLTKQYPKTIHSSWAIDKQYIIGKSWNSTLSEEGQCESWTNSVSSKGSCYTWLNYMSTVPVVNVMFSEVPVQDMPYLRTPMI